MTSCALCSIFACEPCNQTFPFPLKYRQHIAGHPHKLFVRSLAIHPSTRTPNANEEAGLSDSETSEDMSVRRDSSIENEAEDMAARSSFRGDER